MSLFEKVRGAIGNIFSIGLANVINLKNNTGVFEARNAADAGYIIGRGADPVGDDDWVTLRYYNAHVPMGAMGVIRFTVGLATASSTTQIPANAQVVLAQIQVVAAYDNGATLSLGNTAVGVAGFMTTLQNDPTTPNFYTIDQDTDVGAAADVVDCTVAGGVPTVGSSVVSIWYVEPDP